jgi:hypothetical protein
MKSKISTTKSNKPTPEELEVSEAEALEATDTNTEDEIMILQQKTGHRQQISFIIKPKKNI